MTSKQCLLTASAILLTFVLTTSVAVAQGPKGGGPPRSASYLVGSGITYQGQLTRGGSPVNGVTCDFQFGLYDDPSESSQIGTTQTASALVTNGSFTINNLDFGSLAFNGYARWLDIQVRCPSGTGPYTALTPRQPLSPVPYALALPGLITDQNATSPNIIGGYNGNSIPHFLYGATISGGGSWSEENSISGNFGTVGGGYGNQAGLGATVGGGGRNRAFGQKSAIAGGHNNVTNGDVGTIGGGLENSTGTAFGATVGGGEQNIASGAYSTVPGGLLNSATMSYTFAAGRRAKANHSGTFVWADNSVEADWASQADNQFLIRAAGGVGINTNNPATSLQVAKDVSSVGMFGQIEAIGATNSNKRMTMGFDTTNNLGWLQASESYVGYRPMALNPSSGNVLVGSTTDTGDKLYVNGTVRVETLGAAGSTQLCINSSKQIANCSSSVRYKENIVPLMGGLSTVMELRPVTFDWKDSKQPDVGFVAEEINQVAPLLATFSASGRVEGVKYDRVSAILVRAVQEQQQQLDAQDAQIQSLQARLDALEHATGSASLSINSFAFNGWTVGFVLLAVVAFVRRRGGNQ